MANKRVWNAVFGCNLKNDRMISVHFQGKLFNITVIQIYASTSNTEEAERFCEDLQGLLELTPKKDVLFIIGDLNAKVGSQETPGVTGKLGLGIRNETGQRLIEFFQENALVIANSLFQQCSPELSLSRMAVFIRQSPSPSLSPPCVHSSIPSSASPFLPCTWVHRCHPFGLHVYALISDTCFSLSDLLHSVWQTLGPPTSLQMS